MAVSPTKTNSMSRSYMCHVITCIIKTWDLSKSKVSLRAMVAPVGKGGAAPA